MATNKSEADPGFRNGGLSVATICVRTYPNNPSVARKTFGRVAFSSICGAIWRWV